MLGYLANKGPALEPFVISGFIQLLCRVTKLGWFDEGDTMRQLVQETTKFLEVRCRGVAELPCHCACTHRIISSSDCLA
jgi:hypothetical protein